MENAKADIKLLGNNILVSELQDDLVVDGVITMYDTDSPYMFCKIESISLDAFKDLFGECVFDDDNTVEETIYDECINNTILVIKRYAKEEYIGGTYFISSKDVRGIMHKETYKNMLQN